MSKYLSPIIVPDSSLAPGRLHARAEIPPPDRGVFPNLAQGAGETGKPDQRPAVPAADIGWREFFRDPRLQQLIELALTNNPDLRVAMLNVDQTRALLPRPAERPGSHRGHQRQWLAPAHCNRIRRRQWQSATFNQFNVNLGVASYELDLFGRVRSLKKQALETYFASEEARKSAQITLVAEVGAAYLTERELTEQLAVARQTLKARRAAPMT